MDSPLQYAVIELPVEAEEWDPPEVGAHRLSWTRVVVPRFINSRSLYNVVFAYPNWMGRK